MTPSHPPNPSAPRRAVPRASFSVARLPATYPPVSKLSRQLGAGGWKRGTLQSPSSLRPCWDVILSILRDTELFDAEKLYLWVLGDESDGDGVISLPRGPRVHIIGQAPPP
jgi:hypothetical protein